MVRNPRGGLAIVLLFWPLMDRVFGGHGRLIAVKECFYLIGPLRKWSLNQLLTTLTGFLPEQPAVV